MNEKLIRILDEYHALVASRAASAPLNAIRCKRCTVGARCGAAVIGNKRVLVLRKQLKREQRQVQWLAHHLPHLRQLNTEPQRIKQLFVLECVVETATLPTLDAATKKSDAEAPLSL